MHAVFDLMRRLAANNVHYTLGAFREDAIMFTLTLPGERVEVEVFSDGHLEIERFKSDGDILESPDALWELLAQ